MLSKRFLITHGGDSIDSVLETLARVKPDYLVITRTFGGREQRHVVLARAFIDAIQTLRPAPSITALSFLKLEESLGDKSIEIAGIGKENLQKRLRITLRPSLATLTNRGRVVAVLDQIANHPTPIYSLKGIGHVYRPAAKPAPAGLSLEDMLSLQEPIRRERRYAQAPVPAEMLFEGEQREAGPPAPPAPWPVAPVARKPSRPSTGTSAASKPGDVNRYPHATFPRLTKIGRSDTLRVTIYPEPKSVKDLSFEIQSRPGESTIPVLVVIDAPAFEIENGDTQEIPVPVSRKQSPTAKFSLMARREGHLEIRVRFYPRGTFAGEAKLATNAVPANTRIPETPPVMSRATSRIGDVPEGPDLTLIIREKTLPAGRAYDVLLWSPTLHYPSYSIGEIPLLKDPEDRFRRFFFDIERIKFNEEKLASIARSLYTEVVPEKLRDWYWANRGKIASIQIVSSEPWVPWELLKPWDKNSAKDDQYLCEKHAFARWLDGVEQPPKPHLTSVNVVAPPSANLPAARQELNWLEKFGKARGFAVTRALRYEEIKASLRAGGFDVLHFSTHGQFDAAVPSKSILRLEGGDQLDPTDVTGPATRFGKENPLVFLNACQSGQTGYSLTGLGGWAISFLGAGASAFIGTQWSIRDVTAFKFAKAFYDALSRGSRLGEAVQQARIASHQPGDPSWLAFQLYAHPNAMVKLGSK